MTAVRVENEFRRCVLCNGGLISQEPSHSAATFFITEMDFAAFLEINNKPRQVKKPSQGSRRARAHVNELVRR